MDILKIKNLRKIYHTPKQEFLAVDNFSFSLKKGEIIAIVGPSGCGKSTILSILAGLEEKSEGTIEYDKNVKFGYMQQNDNLFDWRTIYKNCNLGLEIQNKENKKYIDRLLKTYGLYDYKDTYPTNLSGGQRQRVSLIRTLATNPEILLLDEPTSALDYQTGLLISDDVFKIVKKENISTIMVTHDIALAISMADKILVLTEKPGTIKKIYNINLKNKKTPIENRKDPNFSYYYDLIWRDIDHNV